MGDRVGLIADKVIQAICAVGVDETIAYPATCTYAVVVSVADHLSNSI
jgi:hypothetical protein